MKQFFSTFFVGFLLLFGSLTLTAQFQQTTIPQPTATSVQWAGRTTPGGSVAFGHANGKLQLLFYSASNMLVTTIEYSFPGRTFLSRDVVEAAPPTCIASGTGGYFLTGNFTDNTTTVQTYGMFLMRVDAAGNVQWFREVPRLVNGSAKAIVAFPNGDVGFVGALDFPNNHVIRVDGCGTTVWGPFNYQVNNGSGVIYPEEMDWDMNSNTLLITGFRRSNNLVDNTLGLSLNAITGAVNWSWIYPTSNRPADRGWDVIANPMAPPMGAIVGDAGDNVNNNGIYSVIFDVNTGIPLSQNVIDNTMTTFEAGRAVQPSHNPGHFVVAGPSSVGTSNAFFMEIDPAGTPIWANTYPMTTTAGDLMESIDLTFGGYYVTTHATQNPQGYHNMWTDMLGQTACCSVDSFPWIEDPQPIQHIPLPLSALTPSEWITGNIMHIPISLMDTICYIDTIPPTFACPLDTTFVLPCGVDSINYCIPIPVVTDDCDPSPTIVASVPWCADYFAGTTTTVTVTATDAAGNSSTCNFDIKVDSSGGGFTAWIDQLRCSLTGQRLTANPGPIGYTYLWSNGSTARSVVVTPGNYCVTITETASGCTAVVCADACKRPKVTVSPTVLKICSGFGHCVPLMAKAGSDAAVTYAWSTGGTSQVEIICPAVTGFYTVTVTNHSGCTATKKRKVFVVNCPNESGCLAPWAKTGGSNTNPINEEASVERTDSNDEVDEMKTDLVEIFPNPANDVIYLDYAEKVTEMESLALYDLTGKKIQDIPVYADGLTEIKVTELPEGVYFLRINDVKMEKIVVIHK